MKTVLFVAFLLTVGCGGSNSPAPTAGSISGTTTFNVSAPNAPNSYTINSLDNPALTVKRGIAYTFNLSASGHPFYIMSIQGADPANAYGSGVTNNGNSTGVLTFVVPMNAPNTLYYDCSIHSGMTGVINVTN